ncbi:hypothetical protein SU69_03400 [Thermosipho melanesiensis]|uniref:Uncharacterized protein n=2 Tax=Thermosipho melanesiensis TaxID=46541 RepID=A6LKS1_THEM4|nr:hypothetical protein [Thermosipho melanesiensis]ABR30522.1 hypothetical protein Tmel_0658 [Thermosipho melanesiensis BI429]APT74840.1 hypothetical protein BW47_03580 [Thermosipho melanesiensis]OOC35613.1 hypothetical protein SU68_03455 [Thermosipho melanesiensis]OOC39287.1 hypothetical protein SU69_03400 [Thermosipho melanesiensis]OOC39373.1 hypothetical protein SU70_03400 [Thermosipho melanesiensis]
MIKNLHKFSEVFGTVLIDEFLMNSFKYTVVLRKINNNWNISYVNEVLVEDFVFNSLEDAKKNFSFLPLIYEIGNVVIFSKEPLPKELLEIYKKSEQFAALFNIEERLTKFSYQISGIGAIISSLTEPLPIDLMLPLLAETVSELFLTPVGVYKLVKNKGTLTYYSGKNIFEKEIEINLNANYYFGKFFNNKYGFIFKEKNYDTFYVILGREKLDLEEQSILNAIGIVFQKGRELLNTTEVYNQTERLLNQYEFILKSLSEFSLHVLSSTNFEELKSNITDYISEIYQSKYVLLYEGKENFTLKFSKQLEKLSFPKIVNKKELENIIKNSLDYYKFKILGNEIYIILGEEILPDFLDKQIKTTLKEIISTEILRAIENVLSHQQLLKEKAKVEFYNTTISFLIENFLSLKEMQPEKILEIFESYSSSFFPFTIKGVSLYNNYFFGKTKALKAIEIKNLTTPIGKVFYESKRDLSFEEKSLLVFSSIIVLSAVEDSFVFGNKEIKKENILEIAKLKYFRYYLEKPKIIEGEHELSVITIKFEDKTYSILPEMFLI